MSEEIIRPSRPSDIPELQRLFAEVFGQSRDEAVWGWKYFDHPRGPHSFVVEVAGRLVAHCGGTEVTMLDGTERYGALQSVDFMSTRRYAGGVGRGGVFVRMVDAFFAAFCGAESIRTVYGFPGERHRLLGERVLGYSPVEIVGGFSAVPLEDRAGYGETFDEEAARRFRAARFGMGAERSEEYLTWRYAHHPLWRYELVEVARWPWRRPAAAILRRDDERNVVLVMEWGGSDDEGALRRLSTRVRQMGRNVHGWGSVHGPMAELLRSNGWSIAPRDHRLETRSFAGRSVPRPGEMYYSLGDYDVD